MIRLILEYLMLIAIVIICAIGAIAVERVDVKLSLLIIAALFTAFIFAFALIDLKRFMANKDRNFAALRRELEKL